jgi:metal-sulfur cluster biosynthetic enzyme
LPTQTRGTLLTAEQIREALCDVDDPEMPISIVDLGMVYDVKLEASGKIVIDLGLTATACPAIEFICQDIRGRLAQEGISPAAVEINLVWDPPWTKARISEEGRFQLRIWGISV